MLNVNRILFPTDFSPRAEDAFSHAAYLAVTYDAALHVFNVVTPERADEVNPMDYLPMERAEDGGAVYLDPTHLDLGANFPADNAEPSEVKIRAVYQKMEGEAPAKSIIDYVNDHDIDLVVMGTHGRQGIERLINGSVSEEVVRQAPCPVFTVLGRDEPQPGPSIRRLLVPVDFSDHAYMGVAYGRELATAYGADLDLLHVVEEVNFPTAYEIDPFAAVSVPDVRDRAREALEQVAREADMQAVTECHVLTGHAARDIVDFAEERETDLIVMPTHGRSGLERFLIGSVTERVMRSASCPVFTIKSFGRSLLPEGALDADASAE